jgi:hypothetical protein
VILWCSRIAIRRLSVIKFVGLAGDVNLIVFTQELEYQFCKETRELALELGTQKSSLNRYLLT